MLARDVMTGAAVTIAPDATVADAARMMVEKGVSGLPVVDLSGQLVGIVFRDDKSLAGEFAKAHGRFVREVMTRNVVCVRYDTPLGRVAKLLWTLDVKRLPVLKNGALVGVISRRDVMRSLAKPAAIEARPQKASDNEIAHGVLSRIDNAPFVAAIQVQLTITDGVVEVAGTVSSENQRQAVLAMIEETPGVARVIDRITVNASLVVPNP